MLYNMHAKHMHDVLRDVCRSGCTISCRRWFAGVQCRSILHWSRLQRRHSAVSSLHPGVGSRRARRAVHAEGHHRLHDVLHLAFLRPHLIATSLRTH